ncbi:MAG: tyrosine-type recombinase/integrase [Syntrophales bacterium]
MSEGKMTKITNQPGVYYRESLTRRYHGKVDRCFYITFKDQSKKVWEKVGWLSEKYSVQTAANIRADRIRSIRHGEELPKKKGQEITFGKLWEHYNRWLDTGKSHVEDDRSRYENHLKDRFADKRLSQIAPLELEELKSDLLKKGLSPATVKHVLVLIRQMINKAIGWDLWQGENPIKKIKLPKLNNKRERYLTQAEAALVLEEMKGASPQLYEMGLMSLCTGMRAGEIFALKWGHCNFEDGIIHVADSKGGEPRKAYMTSAIKEMLENKDRRSPSDLVFKARGSDEIIEARGGEQIKQTSRAFERAIIRLKLNDGIDDPRQRVYFHTLRHTFASWLAIKGTPILTIKELLGHKSLAMTERYAHLSPDHKRTAASVVNDMLKESQDKKASEEPQVEKIVKKKKTRAKTVIQKKKAAPPAQPK